MRKQSLGHKLWFRKTKKQFSELINKIFPTPKSYFEFITAIATIWLAYTANELTIKGNKLAENDSLQQVSIQELKHIAILQQTQATLLQEEINKLSDLVKLSNEQSNIIRKQLFINSKALELQGFEYEIDTRNAFKQFRASLDSVRGNIMIAGMIDSTHHKYITNVQYLINIAKKHCAGEMNNAFLLSDPLLYDHWKQTLIKLREFDEIFTYKVFHDNHIVNIKPYISLTINQCSSLIWKTQLYFNENYTQEAKKRKKYNTDDL